MKRLIITALSAAMLITGTAAYAAGNSETISYTYSAGEGKTYTREMEKLNRGLVAIKTDEGIYLSWRLLDSEDALFGSAEDNVAFDIYRDGEKIATENETTNYLDTEGTINSSYCVVPEGNSPYTSVHIMPATGEKTGKTIIGNIADRFAKVYAVRYGDSGILSGIAQYEPESTGELRFEPGFRADKIFVWNGMKPVNNTLAGEVSVQDASSFDIPLQKPDSVRLPDGATYSYSANDASCADLDGDGEYEIILKWDCNGKDNSQSGYTGDVLLDAYKLDGTLLWRVNLGKNVRAGAHYTQFLVYDFDGDGKAEMTCQTAPGSKDSDGNYVTSVSHVDAIKNMTDEENEEDFRNDGGYILNSDEFLTVFDSKGRAVDTIYYPNQRIDASVWGDTYGNRCDRFTAAVAYMDGVKPYAVYMRGYYFRQNGQRSERQAACAVSFDGKELECKYSFDTYNPSSYRYKSSSSSYYGNTYKGVDGYVSGNEIYVGEGNHNCSVADVDNDGKDEVITGALCYEINDEDILTPRWCTFMEHGDALHIGDYDPTHKGFEFFTVHEDGGPNTMSGKTVEINFGMSVIDADTGEIMFHESAGGDTGRGVMASIGMGGYYQFWSSGNNLRIANGGTDFSLGSKSGLSQNFRIFWDGDLYDELLDGTGVTNWNGRGTDRVFTADGCTAVNGSKNNPSLQADLFGDWREELVYPTRDSSALRVFTTTIPTEYKIKTLMHDPVYRMGVSAEQTSYNQPPHVGIYMGEEVFDAPTVSIEVISEPNKTVYALGEELDLGGLRVQANLEDGTKKEISNYTVSGYDPNTSGTQHITVTYTGVSAAFDVSVKTVKSITVTPPAKTEYAQGQRLDTAGLVVNIVYEDDTEGIAADNYEISGYDSSVTGEQSVTVTYGGQSAEFTVTVKQGEIAMINGTYETTSTDSVLTEIPIGSYEGDFTLEHTVTINSLPANGSSDRNSTAGFFMRFNPPDGVGGGWYINNNTRRGGISFVWKSTTAGAVSDNLKLGETYSFKYEFTNVANGAGAAVALTITDSFGEVIGQSNNLNLRNMSNDNQKTSPLGVIQIYNQASENSTASVTIGDTKIYYGSEEENTDGPFDLSLRVVDSNDTPVEGATVILREVSRPSLGGEGEEDTSDLSLSAVSMNAVTDENGIVIFEAVPAGRYTILYSYSDWRSQPEIITLDKAISKTLKFSQALD